MADAHHSGKKGVEVALAQPVHLGSDHADSVSFSLSQPVVLAPRPSFSCFTPVVPTPTRHSLSFDLSFPRKRESTSSRCAAASSWCRVPAFTSFPLSPPVIPAKAGIHILIVRGNNELMPGARLHVIPTLHPSFSCFIPSPGEDQRHDETCHRQRASTSYYWIPACARMTYGRTFVCHSPNAGLFKRPWYYTCHSRSLHLSFPRKRESTSSPPMIIGHRSRHRGFDSSMRSIFHALLHLLISFSRLMASSMWSCTSK